MIAQGISNATGRQFGFSPARAVGLRLHRCEHHSSGIHRLLDGRTEKEFDGRLGLRRKA